MSRIKGQGGQYLIVLEPRDGIIKSVLARLPHRSTGPAPWQLQASIPVSWEKAYMLFRARGITMWFATSYGVSFFDSFWV